MIVIADGGSTKCDWAVVDTTNATIVKRIVTEGINPFMRTQDQIETIIAQGVVPQVLRLRRAWCCQRCLLRLFVARRSMRRVIWRVL